jgi:hypothetical protein
MIVHPLAKTFPEQLQEGDVALERTVRLATAAVSALGFYILTRL